MNVTRQIEQLAEGGGWLGRTAFWDNGVPHTHAALHRMAASAAAGLAARGVRRGDRVLLALPDGMGVVAAFLGAARIGAPAVIVNPDVTASDHVRIVADCAPHTIVAGAALSGRYAAARHVTADELLALGHTRPVPWPIDVGPDEPLYIQYTSGTTGTPKGAVHTHGQLAAYQRCVGEGVLDVRAEDVLLSVSKVYFAYGFGNALVFPLFTGAGAVLFGHRPNAAEVAAAIGRYGVTLLFSVPGFYAKLLDHCPPEGFGSLRAAVSAGERLLPALGAKVTRSLGAPVLEQIGATEAGHAYCANTVWDNTLGTIGRPVPECELQIRGEGGGPVADGEIGELWVRGPMIMPGYLGAPELTANVLVDGWLNTRDRVSRNPDGTYVHHGRTDDIEVVGGINVAPTEIEAVLARHPGVREVAVVSVRDDAGVTALRAFVVPGTPGVDAARLEPELIALAREHLAAFKVPKSVRVAAELPRTHTGKLRRFVLREGAEAAGGPLRKDVSS
ncbi:AMP-binding protein [Nonomuraea basaltis]|uniref:AMP-binding protein n=1 Tax=Nonomuraea basaltis TaxID=2495887 RepID=UPI00110C68AD|nr:AMP-binding protein [Nonomuraea basaltis]TMR99142.1 acyl-CoA synthase [Nonomuraea basaltis]